ncbi:hypothetical protein Fmac_028462 [Flemingia macrophylla]|uniref:Aminotransferase-like plant mobile domain-containing protein n=1 Tax=Flemingia macrophylla TaxID=520843 RepID=A0ABD1L7Y7_9FABA
MYASCMPPCNRPTIHPFGEMEEYFVGNPLCCLVRRWCSTSAMLRLIHILVGRSYECSTIQHFHIEHNYPGRATIVGHGHFYHFGNLTYIPGGYSLDGAAVVVCFCASQIMGAWNVSALWRPNSYAKRVMESYKMTGVQRLFTHTAFILGGSMVYARAMFHPGYIVLYELCHHVKTEVEYSAIEARDGGKLLPCCKHEFYSTRSATRPLHAYVILAILAFSQPCFIGQIMLAFFDEVIPLEGVSAQELWSNELRHQLPMWQSNNNVEGDGVVTGHAEEIAWAYVIDSGLAKRPACRSLAGHAGIFARHVHYTLAAVPPCHIQDSVSRFFRLVPTAFVLVNLNQMAPSSGVNLVCGPLEHGLLDLQNQHVSTHVWNQAPEWKLIVRHANAVSTTIPGPLMNLLRSAGFGWIAKFSHMKVSTPLVQALVERWRPETHTFHLPVGECTITNDDPKRYFVQCFGLSPPPEAFKDGYSLQLSWLAQHLGHPGPNVQDPVYWQRHARAWICRFLGGVLFVDAGSTCVNIRWLTYLRDVQAIGNYAWGAAALSYLYRNLCRATNYDAKNFGGFVALLQLWVWERIPKLRPTVIPPFDVTEPVGVRWTSQYHALPVVDNVGVIRKTIDCLRRRDCRHGMDIWESICPLVTNRIIEWHQPDRVMRQFGFQQPIPHPPCTPPQVHHLTLRGKNARPLTAVIDDCTNSWNNRRNSCFQRIGPQEGLLSSQSDYMRWFANIAEQIVYYTSDDIARGLALRQLNIYDAADRYVEPAASAPHPGQVVDIPPLPVPRSSREARGPHTRRKVEPVQHVVPLVHERLSRHYYGPSDDTGVYPSQSQEAVHQEYPPAQPYFHLGPKYHVSPHHVPATHVQVPPSYPPVTNAWLSDPPPAWIRDAAKMLFSPEPTRLGDPQTPSAPYHIPYDTLYLQQQFMIGLGGENLMEYQMPIKHMEKRNLNKALDR